jgi:hypothetical protein
MSNIFSDAAAGIPLTPAQRAALKLLQGFLLTALTSGIIAAGQYITTSGTINYGQMAIVVGSQVGLSFVLALAKYLSAQSDTAPLGGSIEALVDAIEKRLDQKYVVTSIPTRRASLKDGEV